MAIGTGIAVAALCIGCCLALIFNRLRKQRDKCGRAFKSIQLTLLRRYDLVPSLVAVVNELSAETRPPVSKVLSAREKALHQCTLSHNPTGGPKMVTELVQAEAVFLHALGQLFDWVENQLDVKKDQRVTDLKVQFATAENRIAFARQTYCDVVNRYNAERDKYPAKICAASMGFRKIELFEWNSREEIVPIKVSFAQ